MANRVFAIAAHPDDIEFGMAGTLITAGRGGLRDPHMNIANGSCGSVEHDAATIAAIRLEEAGERLRGISEPHYIRPWSPTSRSTTRRGCWPE